MAVIEWIPVTWQLYNDYLENARIAYGEKTAKRWENEIVHIYDRLKKHPISYTQEEFETFCKKDPNLWQLQQTAKKELNICARNAAAGSSVNIMPIPPQYTRGLIKGSLIDNIAVIANAQKSEDYQKALRSYEEGKKSNTQFNSIAQQHADSYFEAELKLIEMLANTPGGERYVVGEIATMEKVKSLLSKKA